MSDCGFKDYAQRHLSFGVPNGTVTKPLIRVNGVVDEAPEGYYFSAAYLPPLTLTYDSNTQNLALTVGDNECQKTVMVQLDTPSFCEQFQALQEIPYPPMASPHPGFVAISFPNSQDCYKAQISDLVPPQTVNGSISPITIAGISLGGGGPNDLSFNFSPSQFCAEVQTCIPRQTVNGSTNAITFAGFTFQGSGINDLQINFTQSAFCTAVRNCIPAQSVNGSFAPASFAGFTFQGNGQNNLQVAFNQTDFCAAVQACVPSSVPETPNSATATQTATVNLSGPHNRNIAVDVNVAPGANALVVGPGGLQVNNCSIGAVATTATGTDVVSVLALDANNCMRKVTLDTLTLRDCSNNVIATFKVIPV